MPDTKATRERKGRVKEHQRRRADIEAAVEAAAAPPTASLEGVAEEDELELSFVE